jgi:hypothetical protein
MTTPPPPSYRPSSTLPAGIGTPGMELSAARILSTGGLLVAQAASKIGMISVIGFRKLKTW